MARQLKKILIAEDDICYREKLRKRFEQKGISTVGVRTGLDLTLEFDETFNALLVDTEMPQHSWPLACQILYHKAKQNGAIIIGMSDKPENRKLWREITPYFLSKAEIDRIDIVAELQKLYNH